MGIYHSNGTNTRRYHVDPFGKDCTQRVVGESKNELEWECLTENKIINHYCYLLYISAEDCSKCNEPRWQICCCSTTEIAAIGISAVTSANGISAATPTNGISAATSTNGISAVTSTNGISATYTRKCLSTCRTKIWAILIKSWNNLDDLLRYSLYRYDRLD